MRFFHGGQNKLLDSCRYTRDRPGWIYQANYYPDFGVTDAPNDGDLAQVLIGEGVATSIDRITSAGYNESLQNYITFSFYAKIPELAPNNYFAAQVRLYLTNATPASNYITLVFYEQEFYEFADLTGSFIDCSYTVLDDDWYRFELHIDQRNGPPPMSFFVSFQVNKQHLYPGGAGADKGMALWNVQLEDSTYKKFPSPPIKTDGFSAHDYGDKPYFDITQLPSNLNEIDYDFYEFSKLTSDSTILRTSSCVDTNIKTMRWNMIDYKKHGYMLYMLREALADKLGHNSAITYTENLKYTIKSAIIRVVDFRLNYLTDFKDHASVEVDYLIVETLTC